MLDGAEMPEAGPTGTAAAGSERMARPAAASRLRDRMRMGILRASAQQGHTEPLGSVAAQFWFKNLSWAFDNRSPRFFPVSWNWTPAVATQLASLSPHELTILAVMRG